jgi:hypothetical protein
MFLLRRDVIPHRLKVRGAHGKGTVSFLPGEARESDLGVNPTRGGGFDLPHHGSNGVRGAKAEEKVHMILNAAYGLGDDIECLGSAAEEGVQTITPFLGRGAPSAGPPGAAMALRPNRWFRCAPPPANIRRAYRSYQPLGGDTPSDLRSQFRQMNEDAARGSHSQHPRAAAIRESSPQAVPSREARTHFLAYSKE